MADIASLLGNNKRGAAQSITGLIDVSQFIPRITSTPSNKGLTVRSNLPVELATVIRACGTLPLDKIFWPFASSNMHESTTLCNPKRTTAAGLTKLRLAPESISACTGFPKTRAGMINKIPSSRVLDLGDGAAVGCTATHRPDD